MKSAQVKHRDEALIAARAELQEEPYTTLRELLSHLSDSKFETDLRTELHDSLSGIHHERPSATPE